MTDYVTLEGRNMVRDGLASGQRIGTVMLALGSVGDPKIKEIEKIAREKGVQIQTIPTEELNKMAESRNPQGVIAIMDVPEVISLKQILEKKRNCFILLLNRIDYEQNMGAILRTAWAAGGGAAYVPLIPMSLFQAMKMLHEYAVPVIGVEVEMGKTMYEQKLTGPVAFLMGGESEGLSEPLQKECDYFINIPMQKAVASLNVSVATALVLYEKNRQEKAI